MNLADRRGRYERSRSRSSGAAIDIGTPRDRLAEGLNPPSLRSLSRCSDHGRASTCAGFLTASVVAGYRAERRIGVDRRAITTTRL
jgi:hypothetical protein